MHCYAGIGRTGLVIGSILIRHGIPAKEAIEMMSKARGRNMPQTQGQYEYLIDFGERQGCVPENTDLGQKLSESGNWLTRWIGGK